MIFERSPRYLD